MISVVIPSYNRANFLPRAIKSILNQTFKEWELIISDDGSTDDTYLVVEEYLKDERIKYLKNENRGATAARNSGAKVATQDYLTFLDSDDEAMPNWLLKFAKEIKNGAKVVCCGYNFYDHKGIFVEEQPPVNMGRIYLGKTGRFTNGGVFILEKNLFWLNEGYDEKVRAGQHSEMALRLVRLLEIKNIEIKNIFEPLIKVHVHKGEKIRSNHSALYEGTMYTLKKHQSLFKQNKKIYQDNLSIAALGAFKINKVKESQNLFLQAWKVRPQSIMAFLRYVISLFPILGKKIWK